MSQTSNILDALRRNGHVLDPHAHLAPLNGGVSSEVYLVEDSGRKFVVKRALPKLNVKDDWFADIGRNTSERDYIACVNQMMPGAVPQLYFSCPEKGYFGMEFLDESFTNWKDLLLAGDARIRHAELAGNILGEIHRRTAYDDSLRTQFDTTANFCQLRIEPYLLTTGARHPSLQGAFEAEAKRLEATREALVHGDFSPKNILINGDRMVLLDCEVAWYGDPAFDVAFLLNHFFLGSLYHAPRVLEHQHMVDIFWRTYVQHRSGIDANRIEERLALLLPMLLLARVDGKSPVEYLTPARQEFIRTFAYKSITSPAGLANLCDRWFAEIAKLELLGTNA
jgi:aminoglycoside phosphotransferase (APT) family kinase protein